ncbi:carbon monoxide dehydrogenase subunit G [Chitinivorax tropicus]|uniref:Carbon monoxide dehydrogenase subunit G n=1 Tax=Chitinivorax tropicus TaxID=714531 RepID=A0A840MJS8_9PROT|nr:SRPBCC family protein [Chitinivorax tropicus]MBB5018898.1 carbon monoxide dehydrogenase subunit G [Chitinivorax tropicus]
MHTDVSQEEAWAVLTDFDHMARFVPNVQESTIIEKKGEQLRVHQKGRARYGLLSFGFESVRDIELKPISEIRSKAISGNVKSMNGVTRLSQDGHGSTHITFHSVSVPGVWIPPGVGIAFIKNEISEQFQGMLTEMKRRQPPSMTEQKQAHQKFSHDFEKNS